MQRIGVVCAICALAVAAGCGQKLEVVLLKEVPEIDTAGVDEYLTIDERSISSDRLYVVLKGTAKVALGRGLTVSVTRYKGGERLDTVTARTQTMRSPGEGVEAPSTEAPPMGPAGGGMAGPPPPPDIAPGDPVQLAIDSTTKGGAITKLVLQAQPGP